MPWKLLKIALDVPERERERGIFFFGENRSLFFLALHNVAQNHPRDLEAIPSYLSTLFFFSRNDRGKRRNMLALYSTHSKKIKETTEKQANKQNHQDTLMH